MIPLIQLVLLFSFPLMVIVAAMRDATSFTIPNWISLAIVGLFFPAAFALGMPLQQIGVCMAVGLAGLIAGMAMFAVGWIGGGDAKLFGAAALWLGWSALVPYLLITALAGGALALGLLFARSRYLAPYTTGMGGWLGRLATPGENVPYGVAIAVGALLAFPESGIAGRLLLAA
jgi:prepilin peptidase CpaA